MLKHAEHITREAAHVILTNRIVLFAGMVLGALYGALYMLEVLKSNIGQ